MDVQPPGSAGEATRSVKRTRIVRPYPVHTLEEAALIAATIQQTNAGLPFDRVLLAKAMGTTPASSSFTMKLNSSAKYGLTQGGYNDDRIALTALGESIVAPKRKGEQNQVLVEAALQPELFRRFYQMLDSKRLPEDTYAQNMLQRELGVHPRLTEECLRLVKANGLHVGILGEVGGSIYVSLSGAHAGDREADGADEQPTNGTEAEDRRAAGADGSLTGSRIFVGHAGNQDVVDYLTTVLEPFGIPYDVVECDYDPSRPVSAEVSERMRNCNAAIFVFAAPTDPDWAGRREEKRVQKMLYQLGAASVLYGDRVVSLRQRDIDLGGQDAAVHTLEFDKERPDEVGLALITELHRMGVIAVRT